MEPITYYHRDGKDFGVLALTLAQLRIVRDAIEYALDRAVPALGAGGFDIRDEVLEGIERMEGREKTMARHSHKHTHNQVDGNGHEVHEAVESDHEHEEGPTPEASRHHRYSEEPEATMGPITPGLWQCAIDDASGTPRVYVTRGDESEEVIAQVVRLSDSGGEDRALANAKLMTFSPALLRFVQRVAGQYEGGIITQELQRAAKALIEQLNQVEVRSDADRW